MPKSPSRFSSAGAQRTAANRVRIIAGRWRGRKLAFPDVDGLRPTGDRIRETVFNWLAPVLPGASCLDLFAGSGALGFEALSRGASRCVMLERHPAALRCLRESQQQLSAEGAMIVEADVQQWRPPAGARFDVVFIDPPFAAVDLNPAALLAILLHCDALSENAQVYVEQPVGTGLSPPKGFVCRREQCAGRVCYGLWQRENIL